MMETVKRDSDVQNWMSDVVRQARVTLFIPVAESCLHMAEGRQMGKFQAQSTLQQTEWLEPADVINERRKKKASLRNKYPYAGSDGSQDKEKSVVLVFQTKVAIVDSWGKIFSFDVAEVNEVKIDSNVVLIARVCGES